MGSPLGCAKSKGWDAYCSTAPSLLQEKLHPFEIAAGHEGLQLGLVFSSAEMYFCLFHRVSVVPCCGGSFYPVSSPLSGVIVPRVVVNLLCLREKVSSEHSYTSIFPAVPRVSLSDKINDSLDLQV